jgi:hypothetical protein
MGEPSWANRNLWRCTGYVPGFSAPVEMNNYGLSQMLPQRRVNSSDTAPSTAKYTFNCNIRPIGYATKAMLIALTSIFA